MVSKHVKIKEIRVKDRSNPWMTNEISAFIYKRDYTHRFTNYLNERTQVVTINGKMSNTKLIDKGVPQGSILGPLLFTIFINDFPSCLSNAFCNIFADDTMIGVSDKSITKIQQLLQNAVNDAIKWFGQNK